ncbi:hypothetical protein C7S16_4362 [Burkholderia thailandensis]|uniref:Uncharacterized protein n=1 Tax=Burkholderia thailandensis TaxID=57975 RepID=A0AAW9CRV0_BURTH|nr:hypothetical protein [Burkholderia thailandensis]
MMTKSQPALRRQKLSLSNPTANEIIRRGRATSEAFTRGAKRAFDPLKISNGAHFG